MKQVGLIISKDTLKYIFQKYYNSDILLLCQMFLIKEDKQPQPTAFDETHLDVKLSHGRSQLQ